MNTQSVEYGRDSYRFKSPQDRMNYENAITAKLNAKVLFITGPVGCGKTKLAFDIAGAYGGEKEVGSFPQTESEFLRMLNVVFHSKAKTVIFDNYKGLLKSDQLSNYMTNETTTLRKLGSVSTDTFNNNTLIIITMNGNSTVSEDIMRRGPAFIELL